MRRVSSWLAVGVMALGLAGPTVPAGAAAKVRCSSGTTLHVHGDLRVFGLSRPYRDALHDRAWFQYACRDGSGRITRVGAEYTDDRGQGDSVTRALGFGGSGYLVRAADYNGGESCGDRWFTTLDLATGRAVFADRLDCAFDSDDDFRHPLDFRLSAKGVLVYDVETGAVVAGRPGTREPVALSSPDVANVSTRDIAMRGDLAYWTETTGQGAPVARSASLGDERSGPEAQTHGDGNPPRRPGRCSRLTGTTLASTPNVRVLERGDGRRLACRRGRSAVLRLPPGPYAELRIAGDRWVLARTDRAALVIDTHRPIIVTTAAAPFAQTTLLDDGTFAWIDGDGRLLAQAPAADVPIVLAEATAAPATLASGGRTIYWSQQGAPRRADSPGS